MKMIVVEDYKAMTAELLKLFVEQIRSKADSVLSFTTGATPLGLIQGLAEQINLGLNVGSCTFCNLDEYVGKRDAVYSVYHYMEEYLYQKIRQMPGQVFRLNPEAEDPEAELKRYAEILAKYPRDMQLLGLGTNGHIGANEPGTPFDSTLFVADSWDSTILATKQFYGLTEEETPVRMYTMGFQEIMSAGTIVVAASGEGKAAAVKGMLEGEVSEAVPASILRRHPNVIAVIDRAAASLLTQCAKGGQV